MTPREQAAYDLGLRTAFNMARIIAITMETAPDAMDIRKQAAVAALYEFKATSALLHAVSSGDLTPSEAADVGKAIDAHVKAIEAHEFAERLAALEQASGGKR